MEKNKIAIAFGLVLVSAVANAATPAAETLTWKGVVPFSVAGDEVVITGDMGAPVTAGVLNVNDDGTFTSSTINVEAHKNTGTVAVPVIGDPISGDVVWNLADTLINASETDMGSATLQVKVDGKDFALNTPLTDDYRLAVAVANTTAVDTIKAGESIQVSAVVTAELPVTPPPAP